MQDFADSQEITKEIAEILKTHVNKDLDDIKWALEGSEAGLGRDAINRLTDQNSPLHETHVIFLEKGNIHAGLRYIDSDHGDDFNKVEGIKGKRQISDFMENTMKRGDQIELGHSKSGGINVLYQTENGNYLRVITAENGSIATAYPLRSPDTEWQMMISDTKIDKDVLNSKLDPTAPLRATDVIYLEEGNSMNSGLKSINLTNSDLFKRFLRIDSEEGISNCIKTTMKTDTPVVLLGLKQGINVLYQTDCNTEFNDIHLLVMISNQGAITGVFIQPCKVDDLTWSITTDQSGITDKDMDCFRIRNPWLRYSHIIFSKGHDMTKIYQNNFKHIQEMDEHRFGSAIYKAMLWSEGSVTVKSVGNEPSWIDVAYKNKHSDNFYIHVVIASWGNIVDVYIEPEL